MKAYSWWKVGAILVASVFLFGACEEDDSSSKPKSSGALVINAESAGTMDIQGIVWIETCYEQDPSVWVIAVMALGQTGERTETQYSDATCDTKTGSETFALTVTNDGSVDVVNYVDDTGTITTEPTGFTLPTSATMVTLGFTDDTGASGTFLTLLYVNDLVSPIQLMFGDDSTIADGSTYDAPISGGYPINMFPDGIPEK